jgi:hypothetical protein
MQTMNIARLREGGPCHLEKEYKRHSLLTNLSAVLESMYRIKMKN